MTATIMREAPVAFATREPLIELEGVEKVYRTGKLEYPALRGVDLTIDAGEMVAVVGPSGSGKTTIMNMITGIDRPTAGTVTVDGQAIDALSEEQLAIWRGRNVGIVFQFFQLLPTLTALENAMLPLDFARTRLEARALRDREAQPRAGRARRQARPPARRALRRRAAAGRDRARARLRPEADHRRRADRQPRHADGSGDVRAAAAAERRGQDRPLRHARPRAGGARRPDGDDPRRPRRRTVRRRSWHPHSSRSRSPT